QARGIGAARPLQLPRPRPGPGRGAQGAPPPGDARRGRPRRAGGAGGLGETGAPGYGVADAPGIIEPPSCISAWSSGASGTSVAPAGASIETVPGSLTRIVTVAVSPSVPVWTMSASLIRPVDRSNHRSPVTVPSPARFLSWPSAPAGTLPPMSLP